MFGFAYDDKTAAIHLSKKKTSARTCDEISKGAILLGSNEGAHVKRLLVRGGKVRYLTAFTGCSDEWELPREALHPELVQGYKTRPNVRRKARGLKKRF
jgi:hypothetical protein